MLLIEKKYMKMSIQVDNTWNTIVYNIQVVVPTYFIGMYLWSIVKYYITKRILYTKQVGTYSLGTTYKLIQPSMKTTITNNHPLGKLIDKIWYIKNVISCYFLQKYFYRHSNPSNIIGKLYFN